MNWNRLASKIEKLTKAQRLHPVTLLEPYTRRKPIELDVLWVANKKAAIHMRCKEGHAYLAQ